MTNLKAIFWKGFATLLPLGLTVYGLYWVVVNLEGLLLQLVPDRLYFPGAGLLLAVVLTGVFGALMHFFLFERLVDLGSGVFNRIPVVKSVYSALQDFFSYLGHRSTDELSRVVLVTLADLHGSPGQAIADPGGKLPSGIEASPGRAEGSSQLIGFVTNPRFSLPGQEPEPGTDRVSVYLPMSYQIGGFMVLLPAERLEPLDISVEDAMRLVLTAGVRSR